MHKQRACENGFSQTEEGASLRANKKGSSQKYATQLPK